MDADFAGRWEQADADNPENVMPRTGMVIMYANCPIFWRSSLQTEITLRSLCRRGFPTRVEFAFESMKYGSENFVLTF